MKHLKLTILLTVLMSIVGAKAFAYDFTVKNADGVTIYYSMMSATEVSVAQSNNNDYSGNVVIPESVYYNETTYSVTSIGIDAFYGCSGLTSVTIPNSVTSIGDRAFSGCTGLTSITIPNSVTSIVGSAFSRCSGLTSISVENGNTKYDSRDNCNAIIETASNTLIAGSNTTIIPNSVTSIGKYAFSCRYDLTSITIPNSVTSIGDNAFYYCSGLTSITIPNSVTSIGSHAFEYCSGLTSVTFPNSVTSIDIDAFRGCYLVNVMVNNIKTKASDYAFSSKTYQHAMLYIPEGTWVNAVYDDNSWYKFNHIKEVTTNEEDLAPARAYNLMNTNTFGYLVYDPSSSSVKNVKAFYSLDDADPNNCWQIVEKNGGKCLYSIGAKKYAKMAANGSISLSETPVLLKFKDSTSGISIEDASQSWGFVKDESVEADKAVIIPTHGDVNSDGLVNVTDIVATVNYIMEKPADGFNKEAADLNGDGFVNVTDIVMMVSIIMSGEN